MKTIIRCRFYNVFQYDLEEKFLADMHRKGYVFEEISFPTIYTFSKRSPEEMTYKLKFNRKIDDQANYIQLMKDYGWEYVGTFLEYSYFRRSKDDQQSEDFYTDKESQLDHLNKILWKRFIPICLYVIFYLLVLSGLDPESHFTLALFNIFDSIFWIYLIILVFLIFDYFRLKRKFTGDVDHDQQK